MYSKAETQKLKQEFWVAFAEKYPRKWILYDTKIKDFAFKFHADNKKAEVIAEIGSKDDDKRLGYFEKFERLKNILEEEFIQGLQYEPAYFLESGKYVSRIWISKEGVSINNKGNWDSIFDFFSEKMSAFEDFFEEYGDIIKDT